LLETPGPCSKGLSATPACHLPLLRSPGRAAPAGGPDLAKVSPASRKAIY